MRTPLESLAKRDSRPQGGRDKGCIFSEDFLAFNRTADKVQILHIDLWYADGSTGEMNLVSPHVMNGEDIETQYIYMRQYLAKSSRRLGVVTYQASIGFVQHDDTIKTVVSWAKVDCTAIDPLKPGQYYEHE